jgi:hypothetical protein
MATAKTPTNSSGNTNKNTNTNTNNNVNNNTVNNHIIIPEALVKTPENKSTWLKKAIVGGIITIVMSLVIYYAKENIFNKNNPNTVNQSESSPVIGTKQTKN